MLFLWRDAGESQRVLNESKYQESNKDARHRASPSKDVDSSEDHSGYHWEFESNGGV